MKKYDKEGFYYVDKTGLIRDLLDNWGKVNLFTRPRRYDERLRNDGRENIIGYGIAFEYSGRF